MKLQLNREDKAKILEQGFEYLKTYGIENASLRSLAAKMGYSPANLYNYFHNKSDCIIEITEYGFSKTVNELFEYASRTIGDVKYFFDHALDEVDKHKMALRAVYQVATSPIYGERMRVIGNSIQPVYQKYIKILAKNMNCTEKYMCPLVFSFISIILDYAVWNDREITELQLKDLYVAITTNLDKEKK